MFFFARCSQSSFPDSMLPFLYLFPFTTYRFLRANLFAAIRTYGNVSARSTRNRVQQISSLPFLSARFGPARLRIARSFGGSEFPPPLMSSSLSVMIESLQKDTNSI